MPSSPRSTSAALLGPVVRPLQRFLRLQAASGILLLAGAVAAMVWANLDYAGYDGLFERARTVVAGGLGVRFSLRTLINDGLMTVFFLVVGMEIKRELVVGELDTAAKASLPAIAALGGMLLPATIFLAINRGHPGRVGWGIPMATDIAFCVGVLTLLGDRVPRALVVFVTALAIFDDIGGILVIALFYGDGIHAGWLLAVAALCAGLLAMNRLYVRTGIAWAVATAVVWTSVEHAGIHSAISGVIVWLAIPARARRPSRRVLEELGDHVRSLERKPPDEELEGAEIAMIERKLEQLQAPLGRLVRLLHPFVAFVVMPLFALANTGVAIGQAGAASLGGRVALGAGLGLLVGKPLGIFGFTRLAVRLELAPMPGGATVAQLFGVAIVAGIGFTVALFIAALAFAEAPRLLEQAKLGILMGSTAAGIGGYLLLRVVGRRDGARAR